MRTSLCFLCAVFVFLFVAFTHPLQAQTITTIEKVIDYQLPYPGLLPDNPFYALKQARDWVQLMAASGALDKAKIELEIADKKMAAAIELTEKGKHKFAQESIEKAQTRITRIVNMVSKPKKDETSEERVERTDFIILVGKANLKHRETIETLMKNTPSGQVEQLEDLRQKNIAMQVKLDALR